MSMIRKTVVILGLGLSSILMAKGQLVPRTIIALYDSQIRPAPEDTMIHQFAEMPLNHLGLKLEYHDIRQGLPKIANRNDVRGVMTWFAPDTQFKQPEKYINWAAEAMQAGKKYVIFGSPSFYTSTEKKPTVIKSINHFWRQLGLKDSDQWTDLTFNAKFTIQDKEMVGFERTLSGHKPAYHDIEILNNKATSHLRIKQGNDDADNGADLVVTSPKGGYVAQGYGVYTLYGEDDSDIRKWLVNPFLFFKLAFDTKDLPKPDTTTLAGRRIYYSHIDGDGWNSISQVEAYRDKHTLSAKVVYDKVLKPYPDLPVSVAVIAGDIDTDWEGIEESRKVTKEIMALHHIEAASHTYSHPFAWFFFADENPEKERPFLPLYSGDTWSPDNKLTRFVGKLFGKEDEQVLTELGKHYDVPRAYAKEPFDLHKEIVGAAKEISDLAPEDKKVEIVMWSGNTKPFEKAIKVARENGIMNINGGDSRFDHEYPSYAWVSPIGRQVGKEQQIYASNSNENTYTELWTGRYHGFRYLTQTFRNTETPMRIKPLNVYYHMYSGERDASLNALIENLEYVRKQRILPVAASNYARVAEGFYHTQFQKLAKDQWQVKNRDALETIRFDDGTLKTVDFSKSKGVIGQIHYQGSLYVYLDKNIRVSTIALKENKKLHGFTIANRPYLIEGRWQVSQLKLGKKQFQFKASGFGAGDMIWYVPKSGQYEITLSRDGNELKKYTLKAKKQLLKLNAKVDAIDALEIKVRLVSHV